MDRIVVQPVGAAWEVHAPGLEAQVFKTGGQAEEAARRLAEGLARTGEHVELHLVLRNGELAAKFTCMPPLAQKDRPLIVGGSLLAKATERHSVPAMA